MCGLCVVYVWFVCGLNADCDTIFSSLNVQKEELRMLLSISFVCLDVLHQLRVDHTLAAKLLVVAFV